MENSALAYRMFVVGSLFALLSIFIVMLNYRTQYINQQNKNRGNNKHTSMIFLVPQVLLILANSIFQQFPVYPVSGWLILCIALVDPSIWFVVGLPVVKWFKK